MTIAEQEQQHPGLESKMDPQPVYDQMLDEYTGQLRDYWPSGKLKGRVSLITGGDSGIGRAIAVLFAKEGSDIAIVYKSEEQIDALKTQTLVTQTGQRCLLIASDVGNEKNCAGIIQKVMDEYGKLDILVNNASEQHVCENLQDLEASQLEQTFKTNIFGMIYMAKHAIGVIPKGGKIINLGSVVAYKGKPDLLDYSATKGAIIAFTQSLAKQVAARGIRVNAIAPGPIWTPLIPSSYVDKVEEWSKKAESLPLGRVGQPVEVATCAVFLACSESSFITGQVLHPNGGEIVNS